MHGADEDGEDDYDDEEIEYGDEQVVEGEGNSFEGEADQNDDSYLMSSGKKQRPEDY